MPYPLQLQRFTFKEINIGIYVPDAAFVQQQYLQQQAINNAAVFPYWSKIWPAAYAMSEFLTVHPHYVKNKKVLELACGLALPSLIAAKYANSVCSSDCAADALEIVQQSVVYNGFQHISTAVVNWEQLPAGINADILLLSDINYEPAKFDALYNMLSAFMNNGTTIILSTPQRLMAKPFIERLLPFVIQQENTAVQQNMDEAVLPATVFVLRIRN